MTIIYHMLLGIGVLAYGLLGYGFLLTSKEHGVWAPVAVAISVIWPIGLAIGMVLHAIDRRRERRMRR